MDAGLNVAVAPEGKPLALSVTIPVKPFSPSTDSVKVVCDLSATDCVEGAADSEKSGLPPDADLKVAMMAIHWPVEGWEKVAA